jgi:hypothetical protein
MGRSIFAILAGFVLIFALATGTNMLLAAVAPDTFPASGIVTNDVALVLTLVYVAVYAIGGCYLTARLAPSHPMRHALSLGVLGLAFNIMGVVMTWGQVPAWYSLTGLVLTMPYAWIGGRLAERRREGAGHVTVAAAS